MRATTNKDRSATVCDASTNAGARGHPRAGADAHSTRTDTHPEGAETEFAPQQGLAMTKAAYVEGRKPARVSNLVGAMGPAKIEEVTLMRPFHGNL